MTQAHYEWLQQHSHIFGNVRLKPEELDNLILIYNTITGESQKRTGCARCISNMKKRVFIAYDRYENL